MKRIAAISGGVMMGIILAGCGTTQNTPSSQIIVEEADEPVVQEEITTDTVEQVPPDNIVFPDNVRISGTYKDYEDIELAYSMISKDNEYQIEMNTDTDGFIASLFGSTLYYTEARDSVFDDIKKVTGVSSEIFDDIFDINTYADACNGSEFYMESGNFWIFAGNVSDEHADRTYKPDGDETVSENMDSYTLAEGEVLCITYDNESEDQKISLAEVHKESEFDYPVDEDGKIDNTADILHEDDYDLIIHFDELEQGTSPVYFYVAKDTGILKQIITPDGNCYTVEQIEALPISEEKYDELGSSLVSAGVYESEDPINTFIESITQEKAE